MGLFEKHIKSGEKDKDYSKKWLESASDEELHTEREKVRLTHCSGNEKHGAFCTDLMLN